MVNAVQAALDEDQKALYDEALRVAKSHTVEVEHAGRGDRGRADRLGPDAWDKVGVDGEAKANASGAHRALPGPPGRQRAGRDDEPGMIALVGRSY